MPSAVRLRLSTLIPTIALLALSPLAVAAEWPYDYAIKAVAWDGDLPTLIGQPTRSSDTAMSGNGWIAATVKVTANETLTGTVMRRDPANGTWTDIDYPTDATYGFRHDRCDIVINNNGTIALTVEANVSPSGMDLIAYRRVGDSGWTLPTSTTRTSQAWRLETNGNRFLGGRAADAPSDVLLPVTWSDSFAYTDVSGNFPGLHVGNVDGLYGNGAMVVWASQTEDTNEDYRWSFISDITTGSPTITHLTKLSSPAITRTVPVSGGGTATAADIPRHQRDVEPPDLRLGDG